MLNEQELIALQRLVHFLNQQDSGGHDLCFDVAVIDSCGETPCRIEKRDDNDYQLLFGPA